MSDTEIVDTLTQTVEKQARIIRELYSIVKQLSAVTSIDDEVLAHLEELESQRT